MLSERPALTFVGIIVAAVALALPGWAFMLAQTLGPLVSRLPVAEVTAFVSTSAGASEVKALAARLESIDGVARVRVISREQAWAEIQRRARDGQGFADVRPNPLPDAIAVEFQPQLAASTVESAIGTITKQPRVDSVQADIEWYRRLLGILQAAAGAGFALIALFAVLGAVVVLGLVRLLAVVDPSELHLLDQIGAEDGFMRRPFVYAGATLLGLAAAGGLGLVAAGRQFVSGPLGALGKHFGLELALGYPPWPLVLAFVAGCLLIGAAAGNTFARTQIALAKARP
jgi:cell division transport system permease protein